MSEHLIIKREKCGRCNGEGRIHLPGFETLINPSGRYPCSDCTDGISETRIDADEWLRSRLEGMTALAASHTRLLEAAKVGRDTILSEFGTPHGIGSSMRGASAVLMRLILAGRNDYFETGDYYEK